MSATAVAPTAYEVALAAVPDAKKVTLPPAAPSPTRQVAGGKRLPHPARVKEAARKGEKDPVKAAAAKMEQESRAKTAAIKAGKLTKKEKARSTGNGGGPVQRLTTEWIGKDKKDVQVKDRVRTADGIVIDVIGRWTRRKGDKLIPCVTGHIVSFGSAKTDATEGGKGKSIGSRLNAVAAEVTHCK
jgi:hypothetical protein